MEHYRDDSSSRRSQVNRSIESLHGKLKTARNPFQQSSIAGELGRLEQEKMQLDSLFDDPQEPSEEPEAPEDRFPVLNTIYSAHPDLLRKATHLERDIRATILYLHQFETEFLGMFTSRRMKLDVKFSVERDSFYDLFFQVSRSLKNYRTEADRIVEGTYTKTYEADILKRKVEMRHALLIEIDWFFRKLKRFARNLLADIQGEGLLCQNPDDVLSYSKIDRERILRNRTVREGISLLSELASEAVDYVEIPEFQQRPL